jgi:proteasome lid subunit RPN8/RPN11
MLKIDQREWERLRQHGEEVYPQECCGVLLGETHDGVRRVREAVRCANSRTDSPQNRYAIEPSDLFSVLHEARARNLEIVGFYHSHPDHSACWSATDLEEAHWTGCAYVITGVEGGRATRTNAFVLTGGDTGEGEEAKRFDEDDIEIG